MVTPEYGGGSSVTMRTLDQLEQTHQAALAAHQEALRHIQAVQTLLPTLRMQVSQLEERRV